MVFYIIFKTLQGLCGSVYSTWSGYLRRRMYSSRILKANAVFLEVSNHNELEYDLILFPACDCMLPFLFLILDPLRT